MAINDELLYEVNEQGELVVVRSKESNQKVYLRFSNLTKRPIAIAWRDFQGVRRHYMRLKPNEAYVVDSFVTHPWEFTDAATKERYCVKNKHIFRAPPSIGGMMYRTNWNVTIGVRTLRHTALLAMATRIQRPELVPELGLPRGLETELQELVRQIREDDLAE